MVAVLSRTPSHTRSHRRVAFFALTRVHSFLHDAHPFSHANLTVSASHTNLTLPVSHAHLTLPVSSHPPCPTHKHHPPSLSQLSGVWRDITLQPIADEPHTESERHTLDERESMYMCERLQLCVQPVCVLKKPFDLLPYIFPSFRSLVSPYLYLPLYVRTLLHWSCALYYSLTLCIILSHALYYSLGCLFFPTRAHAYCMHAQIE